MKRASERQITKDDAETGTLDEDSAPQGSFEKAPPEVLAKRRILKVRRSLPSAASDTAKSNPFASLSADAPSQITPAPDSPLPSKDAEPEKAQNGSEEPPARDIPVPKPQADAKPVGQQDSTRNGTLDSHISTPAPDVTKPHEPPNSESLKPSAENVQDVATGKEQSAGNAAVVQEPANGPADAKEDEKKGDEQDGKQNEKEEGKQNGKPDDTQGNNQDVKQVAKQDGEVDGNTEKKSDVTAGENAPATTEKTAGATVEAASNGRTEEKTDGPEAARAEQTAEGKSDDGRAVPSNPLFASATQSDIQGGLSKPNGSALNAPISFGNLGGSAPLTFANAAASDAGTFKFTPAPVTEPKSVPQREFKEAKVETGEEDERELFRTRAKLYSLENLESGPRWKERGVGVLKLKLHKEKNTARLLMRTEATLRVILNTPVYAGMKFDPATEKSLRFQGFEEVDKDDKKALTFLARFTSRDIASGLVEAVHNLESKKEVN